VKVNALSRKLRPAGAVRRLRRELSDPDIGWTVLAFVMVIAGAALGRKALAAGWRATSGTEPPVSPSTKDATWVESLVWGIVTGAIIGVLRALSLQGAQVAERRWS
jgi:hypothetical protein